MAITICSSERTFSTLKRNKNYLRFNIEEDRLKLLSLLATETDLVNQIDLDDMVMDFTAQKSRRKILSM